MKVKVERELLLLLLLLLLLVREMELGEGWEIERGEERGEEDEEFEEEISQEDKGCEGARVSLADSMLCGGGRGGKSIPKPKPNCRFQKRTKPKRIAKLLAAFLLSCVTVVVAVLLLLLRLSFATS